MTRHPILQLVLHRMGDSAGIAAAWVIRRAGSLACAADVVDDLKFGDGWIP
jgi:hypothetical protein